jgi:hypothetical protein
MNKERWLRLEFAIMSAIARVAFWQLAGFAWPALAARF